MASHARTLFAFRHSLGSLRHHTKSPVSYLQYVSCRSSPSRGYHKTVPVKLGVAQAVQQHEPETHNTASTDQTSEVTNPLGHPDFFGVRSLVTMADLFDARVHLGHKSGTRNEFMTPYIFGTRLGVDILDLEQSVELLRDALNVAAHIAFRQGVILFVSRTLQTLPIVEETARECGEYAHCREWKGGTFTNATIQYGSVTRMPDLVIFISTHNTIFEQHIAVVETAKMNIPSVGIVDSSCDPRLITYPVPGNDDTPSAVKLYCRLFKEAILKGKAKRTEMDANV